MVAKKIGKCRRADSPILSTKGDTDAVTVNNVIAAADHGFFVGERRPGEIDTWRHAVLVARKDIAIRMTRRSEVNNSSFVRNLWIFLTEIKIGQCIRTLAEPTEDVIAQANVKSEVWSNAKVILHVKS